MYHSSENYQKLRGEAPQIHPAGRGTLTAPCSNVVSINRNPQGNVYNITGVVAHGEKTKRSVASEPFGAVA